jgi:glycosyltransferase involved in cell wall biosynthesis
MKIALNGINARSEHDYRYINKLIECFGNLASQNSFILIGRRGQEDFYIPAPGNFQYRFCNLRVPVSDDDGLWVNNLIENILAECGCNLLMDFGTAQSRDTNFPRVTLTNIVEKPESGCNRGDKAVTRKRLKLVSRSAVKDTEKSRGIIFPTRYLHNEIPKSAKTGNAKLGKANSRKAKVARTGDRQVLSRYGIDRPFFLSPVSSNGIKEFSLMLKAYALVAKDNPDAPQLVLVGSDESPAQVGEIMGAINKSPANSGIIYSGLIPDEDFMALLDSAHAFLVSTEIFDIEEILIAAMNSGCAIICANAQVCREITDGAALYFDPQNWRDLAFKLRLITEDRDLSGFLKQQSLEKATRFSWENTTKQMLDFFGDIVADHRRTAEMATMKN